RCWLKIHHMNGLATHRVLGWLEGLGRITLLGVEAARSLISQRVDWRGLTYQLYFIGVKSQSVVLITGAFTGMVLCAQTYFQFHKVKMDTATLAVVSVAMGSELGPVLTAPMVAGRVGAGMAAVVFAAVQALISCYKGMNCREGAEGVGRATTEAVVYSSITILISNFFLTLFLTRLLGA